MNTPVFSFARTRVARLSMAAGTLFVGLATGRAETVAIATRVFHGYTRTQLPDGSFKPETYAFANGGHWGDGLVAGDSISDMPFRYLAGALAVPMAKRGYVPSKDPANTDLLIFVMWGTTKDTKMQMNSATTRNLQYAMEQMRLSRASGLLRNGFTQNGTRTAISAGGPRDQDLSAAENASETYFLAAVVEQRAREREDGRKAMLLGFQDELNKAGDLSHTDFMDDFWADLRADRYFVILKAFDFRLAAGKDHTRKILWEARFSVPRQSNDFIDILPSMTKYASQFFGQDTKGLVRDPLPEVRVVLGPLRTVEVETVSK